MSKFQLIENCAAEKTAIVVVGTGETAAPAIGELLAALGCDVSASENKGSTSKITEFNDAVLESSGSSRNDWVGFDTRWLASPKAAEFLGRALELLQAEFGGSYLSVIQDSGTALLLPFWNVVFDRAGVVPRYLLLTSDPAEVAEELSGRFGIERRAAHLVWLRSALDAEANSRGKLRAFADTAQLSSDPATAVRSFSKSLQITFPRDVRRALASKDSPVSQFSHLVRLSKAAAADPSSATPAADWVTATYQILRGWASSGETPEGKTVLDAIREAFDEAVPAFVGVGPGGSQNGASAAVAEGNLESEIEKLQKADAEKAEALERAQEEVRARYSEIVTLTRMLATETAAARKFERSANRLGRIAQALQRGAAGRGVGKWFRRLLPWAWHARRVTRTIEREGLFDVRAYLAVNPDVESAGIDPLRHYLAHGANEGRPLGIE